MHRSRRPRTERLARAIGLAFRARGTTPFGAPAAELEEQPDVEAAFDRVETRRDSDSPNHLVHDGDSFKTSHVERRTMRR